MDKNIFGNFQIDEGYIIILNKDENDCLIGKVEVLEHKVFGNFNRNFEMDEGK